ncbi:3-dehydroquinate synthase [Flagellimonas algicola]|uniref:3-dehydroquinate synthase n=1 Tax=Flagellimonas algicola TaxID=2583815 RepID=A0ABY2WT40_9FLAO|nr:3-dehydroquinate synthase [Allomuricauda algicola]TMU57684.1 3-dehydroquinate synthase [Allomuricauda algicola]
MKKERTLEQKFQVSFQFKVLFTHQIFDVDNTILHKLLSENAMNTSKALVVVDSGVKDAHPTLLPAIENYFDNFGKSIALQGDILEIPGGEAAKNDEALIKSILDKVNRFGIDRHSYIIAIGGGAVLDAVGFAAAIAHRGVRHIRIPTTVLSQNDSGIGVKNGINSYGKKNFTGCFASPYAVINDATFLTTLDDRDWRSGIAEAIKVALIMDLDFFEWIETEADALANRNMEVMDELIYRCADLHMQHIRTSGDAFEQGSSRPLDFGHWAAHKLEQLSHFSLRHGEAVAIGIALDSTYSQLKGYLNQPSLYRILNLMTTLGFELHHPELNDQVIQGLEEFREHLGGQLTIMLLNAIGKGFEVHEMDEELVLEAMNYVQQYSAQKIEM